MVGRWLVVLPLLVDFDKVTLQPLAREARQLHPGDCCPCPASGSRSGDMLSDDDTSMKCSSQPRADDLDASASVLLPALRAMQPLVKQFNQKTEPKPLLQPEVGLASSVLETLRQATDEEYQEALARDVARSAAKLIETSLNPSNEAVTETFQNKVTIFLNSNDDDMDDNLPEQSHVQETRCIHSPLQSFHKNRQLRISQPIPKIEHIELTRKPARKLQFKSILHRNHQDVDNVIGTSNIQERVTQPNLNQNSETINLGSLSTLLSPFTQNDFETTEVQNKQDKNISNAFSRSKKIKPQVHLKLRELINNLEDIPKKEILKVPAINLKKNDNTFDLSQLKLKPMHPLYNNKPLLLKDLLKLKDVELIPTKNIAAEKSSNPSLNFRLRSSRVNSYDPEIDSCKENNSNLVPKMNNNIKMTINPTHPEITDTEISPTNSNLVFESKNNEISRDITQNFVPLECIAGSENSDTASTKDFSDQNSFDYSELKNEENVYQNVYISDKCNEPIIKSFAQQIPNNEHKIEEFNDIELAKNLEICQDINYAESNNDGSQIDLFEDLDTPVEFDNNSLIPISHLKNNDVIQDTINEDSLNDPVADTSNNLLHIEKQFNTGKSAVNIKKHIDNNHSQANPNLVPEYPSSLKKSNYCSNEKSQERDSMQQESPENNMNLPIKNTHEILWDVSDDPRKVSFKDLEEMSNSILSLSENEATKRENVYKYCSNENLGQANDNMQNIATSTPEFEKNPKKTDTAVTSNMKSGLNAIDNSNENLCKLSEEKPNMNKGDLKKNIKSAVDNTEMRVSASEPEYKLKIPLYKNTIQNESEITTKDTLGSNNVTVIDKHSNFLDNLRLKLEDLLSPTEKVTLSDIRNSPDDIINESSNIHPVVSKLNNLEKLQPTPQTLLRKILPPKLTGNTLNSHKNILPAPSDVVQPLMSKSLKLLNIPLEVSRPFEDPNLSITAVSDGLRSHTENTIQNVKGALESKLKDSQSFRFSRPSNIIDTHDILESISDRRDEMQQKLEAIHLDLNDRLSSFQRSIVNHFNVPSEENFKFHGDNTGGFRAINVPVGKELLFPETPKLRKVNHEYNYFPHRISVPNNEKHMKINLKIPNISTVSDKTRFPNSNKKISLQNSILHSTSTVIPTLQPRPNVLKNNIDSSPKVIGEILSNVRSSKVPILSEQKLTKPKTSLLKFDRTINNSEDPYNSLTSSTSINMPVKSFKVNTDNQELTKNYYSVGSPINKVRKTLLQRNQNQKSSNALSNTRQELNINGSLDNINHTNVKQKISLNRMKKERAKVGSRDNDELMNSPTSHVDTIHRSQIEPELRLVEPMKENVPYKCKLICYTDS